MSVSGTVHHVAADDLVSNFYRGSELPLLVSLERWHLDSARKIVAADLADVVERTLYTVVNAADKTRSELGAHGFARGFNSLTRTEARCLLIYLNGGAVAVHLDYLADKTLFADAYNVEHIGVSHTLRNNERT